MVRNPITAAIVALFIEAVAALIVYGIWRLL